MTSRIRLFIVGLFASMALLFTTMVAPASAHPGDWYTQYVLTQNHMNSGYGAGYYQTSEVYGDHSRVFTYRYPKWVVGSGLYTCTRYLYIGHGYDIWGSTAGYCFHA